MTPRVSILIPCHNAGRWVAATLESALAQTWPRTEIILVDDGSTDDSLAVARAFEPRGVRVVSQPNAGASAARNHALRLASGDYIQFLDADDLLAPDKIARQVKALSLSPTAMLASGVWGRFEEKPANARFNPEAVYAARDGVEFLQLHYETGSMMQPAAWLAARPLLECAGPWNETLSLNDDGEYFARVMLAAGPIVHCPDARVYYRSGHAASLSRRNDRRALESLHKSVVLTIAYLRQFDASPRTLAACAYAWKKLAFELYPGLSALSREAEAHMRELGGSNRPLPGSRSFQIFARILGWRAAVRVRDFFRR